MALILILQNTTELKPCSDYRYEVLVGDGTPSGSTRLAAGTITKHWRRDGWQRLVEKLLQQHPPEPL